jgi:large repetitive protein
MTHDDARQNLKPLVDDGTGVLAIVALVAGIAFGASGPLFYVGLAPGLVAGPSLGGLAVLGAIFLGGVSTLAVLVALGAGRRPHLGVAIVVASASLLIGVVLGGRLGASTGVGGWSARGAASPSPTPLTEPGWAITGSMAQARTGHTATLLQTGRVLVVGGTGANGRDLASAELYDPASGRWTVTGTMSSAHSGQRAILLRDGRVLVLDDGRGDAEVYDPVTGSWKPGAPMPVRRTFYTATVIADGRVLVAGGRDPDSGESLASTQVFDPARGTWTAGRPMTLARAGHSATLLEDGRVLVAGGFAPAVLRSFPEGTFPVEPQQASAELFDPRTDRWHPTGSMAAARAMHAATLLADGGVFVAHGELGAQPGGGTVEIYRPDTGAWHIGGKLTQSLGGGATASLLPDGRVLVAYPWGAPLEIDDPATGTSRAVANAHSTTSGSTSTVLADGRILLAGGMLVSSPHGWGIESTVLASAHLYDPRN